MFVRLLVLSLLAFVLTLGSADAYAQNQRGRQSQEQQDSQRGSSDLPDSVRRVEQQTGGEVLRAEPMQRDGHEVYRIKVLTSDGRVRVMQDDPQRRRQDDSQQRRQDDSQQRRGSSRQEGPSRRSSPPRSDNSGGGRSNGNNTSDESEPPPF